MDDAEGWIRAGPSCVDLEGAGLRRYAVALPGAERPGAEHVLPVVVARGGDGPTVLVVGGTHGDEYEGQIAVSNLVRSLDSTQVRGTVVALPLHNPLACRAGTRRTPEDGCDLNRLYGIPGAPAGVSATIARFVGDRLLRAADWVVDLHSGGEAHEFVLSANLQATVGSLEYHAMLPALLAFGAPYAIVFDEAGAGHLAMPHTGTLEGLARRMGKRAISSELGGGGRVTPRSFIAAENGLRNLLAHIGVVPAARDARADAPVPLLVGLRRPEHHVSTPIAGRLAPRAWLGDAVRRGDVLGVVHPLVDPLAPPVPIHALSDGVVVAVASRGVQSEGAVVFYVAEVIDRAPA